MPDYYSVPDYHVAPDTIDRRNLNFTMPLPIQPRRLAEPVAGLRPHRPGIRPHSCVFTSRDQGQLVRRAVKTQTFEAPSDAPDALRKLGDWLA